MALIKCPECGRQISDKAVACPGCGFPICDVGVQPKTPIEKLVDEIYEKYPNEKVKAIKVLREATGMDLKPAKDIMDLKFSGKNSTEKFNKAILEQKKRDDLAIRKAELREMKNQNREQMQHNLEALSNAFGSGSAKPKKGVSYESKKLSVGRAAIGYGLAGPAGAVLGGLSSGKRQAVDPETGKKLSKREVKKRMK